MRSPAHMYFVAIVCPPALNVKVLAFKNWMKENFGCVVALRSPAHITLVPPFWLGDEAVAGLQSVLQSFKTGLGELSINTKGFSHFGKHVLFIAVEADPVLERLKREVEEHFAAAIPAIKKETRPFHPHITIANRDMKPSHFEKAWQRFAKLPFFETFDASALSLLKLEQNGWVVADRKEW